MHYVCLIVGFIWHCLVASCLVIAVSLAAFFWLKSAMLPTVKQLNVLAAVFSADALFFTLGGLEPLGFATVGSIFGILFLCVGLKGIKNKEFYDKFFVEDYALDPRLKRVLNFFCGRDNHIIKAIEAAKMPSISTISEEGKAATNLSPDENINPPQG